MILRDTSKSHASRKAEGGPALLSVDKAVKGIFRKLKNNKEQTQQLRKAQTSALFHKIQKDRKKNPLNKQVEKMLEKAKAHKQQRDGIELLTIDNVGYQGSVERQ